LEKKRRREKENKSKALNPKSKGGKMEEKKKYDLEERTLVFLKNVIVF
jgi:hypothetical protein